MKRLCALYHLARADLTERVRRHSFLVVLLLMVLLAYLLVPPTGAGYVVGLHLYDQSAKVGYRGLYNSAWVGTMVATIGGWLLSLLGFYLVKGSVERDRQTGVGEILASTPLARSLYVPGKWLSSAALLGSLVAIVATGTLVMQLLRGEVMQVELGALLAPFLWFALPPLLLAAALALLFETIPFLARGPGNVAYALIWIVTLPFVFMSVSGMDIVAPDVVATLQQQSPEAEIDASIGINPASYGDPQLFLWQGIDWTASILLGRLAWLGGALAALLIAACGFRHFDPLSNPREQRSPGRGHAPTRAAPGSAARVRQRMRLTSFVDRRGRSRFGQVLLAELRLALRGHPWWGYLLALIFVAGGSLASIETARSHILPLAWIMPLFVWSAMGTREAHHGTAQLVFPNPHALRRQLPSLWLSGVLVALLAGSGVGLRLLAAGEGGALFGWTVGALFIPSLALALGAWTGSSKAFEAIYTILWYLGPVNRTASLDFMGAMEESVAAGVPWVYLGLVILLLATAVAGRARQFWATMW